MSLIYEPQGKAREYSPLALNIYNGCDHDCKYCYLKNINFNISKPIPTVKKDLLEKLEKELIKTRIEKQVLISFVGDCYCSYDKEVKQTREVLKLLLKYQISVAILTKGGTRCLRDIDLFRQFKNIKLGATLTFDNPYDTLDWEKGASLPEDRLQALKILHNEGIKTFASFEPVIKPEQSLRLMKITLPYVDQYKIGKLNHNKQIADSIDWKKFAMKSIELMRDNNKQFYIKEDLRKYLPEDVLSEKEKDMDYLAFKPMLEYQSSLF